MDFRQVSQEVNNQMNMIYSYKMREGRTALRKGYGDSLSKKLTFVLRSKGLNFLRGPGTLVGKSCTSEAPTWG